MPISNFQPIRLLDPDCWYKSAYLMANSADPDQLASEEANRSGSTLFAKAGHLGSAGLGLRSEGVAIFGVNTVYKQKFFF